MPPTLSTYWPYLAAFISPVLSFATAYLVIRINRAYSETKEERTAREASDLKWRESRLAAEQALGERITTENRERLQWQLKREAELASIAGILEESTEVQKLVAAMAATQQGHSGQLTQLNERINMLQQHVNTLTLSFPHAKPRN